MKNKVTLYGNGFQALEWNDIIFWRAIMTLYLGTETVIISSRRQPNLPNVLFES